MNLIFFLLVGVAFIVAAIAQWNFIPQTPDAISPMDAMTTAIVEAAGTAVELAIGLIGMMALFLGLMKIVEEAGLLKVIARLMQPIMVRLFPEVPADHPAMGAIIMNISANFLGLDNAATPFGLKAMEELDKLNPVKGTASNAMVLFLTINTAGVTLLPTSVIALRAKLGSHDPASIVPTTIFATVVAMVCAVGAAKFLQRFFPVTVPVTDNASVDLPEAVAVADSETSVEPAETYMPVEGYPFWMSLIGLAAIVATVPLMIYYGRSISPWIIPGLIFAMLAYGFCRKVPIYETFITGAKEGSVIAFRIIPYLVAILVSIAMFRQSGAMEMLLGPLGAMTAPLGLPAEGLTMAMMRSLSGSGAMGLLASFLENPAIGPDSYKGNLLSTLYGSSETTFYVLAVYFGAVQVRRVRHALVAGIFADIVAAIAAVVICGILFS